MTFFIGIVKFTVSLGFNPQIFFKIRRACYDVQTPVVKSSVDLSESAIQAVYAFYIEQAFAVRRIRYYAPVFLFTFKLGDVACLQVYLFADARSFGVSHG